MSSRKPKQFIRDAKTGVLTSAFVEKINAVEGLTLSARMRTLLEATKDRPGDERRQLIRAQFARRPA